MKHLFPDAQKQGEPFDDVLLSPRISTTKLDAPHTTFSVRERLELNVRSPKQLHLKDLNSEEANNTRTKSPYPLAVTPNPRHSPIQLDDLGHEHLECKDEGYLERDSTLKTNLTDIMSAMPLHQQLVTSPSLDLSRAQEESPVNEIPSETLRIDEKAAQSREANLGSFVLRQDENVTFDEGVHAVSLSQYNTTETKVRKRERGSRKTTATFDQPHNHNIAAKAKNTRTTRQQIEVRRVIGKGRENYSFARKPPTHNVDHCPRIIKHHINMPSLTERRLSQSARRKLLRDLSCKSERETVEQKLPQASLESLLQEGFLEVGNHRKPSHIAKQTKFKTESPNLPKYSCEQPKFSPPSHSPVSTTKQISDGEGGPLSESLICRPNGSGAPAVKIRKHLAVMSFATSHHDQVVAGKRKKSTIKEKSYNAQARYAQQLIAERKGQESELKLRRERKEELVKISRHNQKMVAKRKREKKSERTVLNDSIVKEFAAWQNPLAIREDSMLRVIKHHSHDAVPIIIPRDEARHLHERYHLPLSDMESSAAPES